MLINQIIARLRAGTSSARSIGGAAALDAAMRGTLATPAVFVVPLAEHAAEMPRTGVFRQRMTLQFSVIQVVANSRDNTGAAGLMEIEPIRAQVRIALAGWVPNEANGEPVLAVGGELVQADGDGRLWWADEFQIDYFYEGSA